MLTTIDTMIINLI